MSQDEFVVPDSPCFASSEQASGGQEERCRYIQGEGPLCEACGRPWYYHGGPEVEQWLEDSDEDSITGSSTGADSSGDDF